MTTQDPSLRRLGNSDLHLTPVGYGSWAIGGAGWRFAWGPQDDADSVAAILRALELGVTWIDTAMIYGLGHAEQVVARALEQWRGLKPLIFTKCGLRTDDAGNVLRVLKADSLRRECEDSLRRLKVGVIDLYQIHWPVENLAEIEEGWGAMAELKRAGKVRWIGVSNFNVEQMRRCQAVAPITSLQPPYSLVHREVEAAESPYCQREGIGVLAYSPMASGLLTGAMTRQRVAALPEDDWRKRHADFNDPDFAKHLALVERLKAVGARHGRTPGEVAIAWTLRHPAVTAAIVGARNAQQAEGVIRAGDLQLSDAEAAEIEGGQ